MDHTHIRTYFLIIFTTLLAVLTVWMLRPFLITLGLAAVFAVIFNPLCNRISRDGKMSRGISSFLTLLIGLICIAVPLTFLGVQLFKEAENVYTHISQPGSVLHAQDAITRLGTSLDSSLPGAGSYIASASANLSAYVRSALGYSLSHAAVVFSGTLAFVLQLFIFLITLYYLLKESPRLTYSIGKYSPLNELETRTLVNRMVNTINSVVKGSLIAIIQGALTAIGFLIFGVANPLLWGTIAIIGALIPSVGTALVFVPAVLYLFFTDHTGAAIGLGIFGLFGVGMIDNFLRPYLVGGRASIHPVLILLSVLGGLALFGPAGLFLGPLVISLLLGLLSFYNVSENKV